MKNLIHIRRWITSRQLPKTGQITQYQDKDDGYYEFGWWQGRYNADNKTRFIEKIIDGDTVVMDLATGLLWPANANGAGCNNGSNITWSNAIIYANGLTFAGFSDWYIPNAIEIYSLIVNDIALVGNALIKNPPFINTALLLFWSNTTDTSDTTKAFYTDFNNGKIGSNLKSNSYKMRACRML